jgi:methylthioribose-1-phosphate isomerase
MSEVEAVAFKHGNIYLIDQTKLPLQEEYIITDKLERIAIAIERLEVRGAPAIGVTAAYALALALKTIPPTQYDSVFSYAYQRLYATRPTAVNLFFALNEIKKVFDANKNEPELYQLLLKRAIEIHEEDKILCERMATNGLEIFQQKSRVLTHCNTGALATGGKGTALNIIRHAFENGLVNHVYANETRPLLQGSRLTAYELDKYGIPFSIITDSSAAFLMQQGKVDLVITGADTIALNGDVANKIGTYNLAVLCFHHNIPFYIAAPYTSIDKKCVKGIDINVELRNKNELTRFGNHLITKDEYEAYCPAFDITPNRLIKGIITEKKLYTPRFDFSNV